MSEAKLQFWLLITLLGMTMGGMMLILTGCSTKDNDLKTSQCRLKLDFNCDCEKDSSILADTVDSATTIK